jgi:hypothetical protein
MVGVSGRALSRITSSFMVIVSDGSKINLGLSLKFEAKSLKVIDYSRKIGQHWEFSQKAIDLIREYKVRYQLVDSSPTSLNRSGYRPSSPLSLGSSITAETVCPSFVNSIY